MSFGWNSIVKMTNEAYSDAVLIGPVIRRSSTMGADFLLLPAKSDFDLTVAAVRAVADDKIVADTIPMVFLSMHPVKDRCVAVFGCRVVYDDSRPFFFQPGRRKPVARNMFIYALFGGLGRGNLRRWRLQFNMRIIHNLRHWLMTRTARQNEQETPDSKNFAEYSLKFPFHMFLVRSLISPEGACR